MSRQSGLILPAILVFVFALGVSGCASPEKVARREFLRDHPGYLIEDAFVGEGDGAVAYVHIRYRQSGQTLVSEVIWQCARNENAGDWECVALE